MKPSDRPLFIGVAIAFFFTLTLAAFAQEQPPAPPPAESAPPAREPAAKPKPSAASDFAAGFVEGFSDAGDAAKKPAKLRRLDDPAPRTTDDAKTADPEKSTLRRIDADGATEEAAPAGPAGNAKDLAKLRRSMRQGHGGNDYVRVGEDIHVESADTIESDTIGILGDVQIDGQVHGNTVAVLGDVTINGTVTGDVVAVLGDVILGPKAHVEGSVTSKGGEIHREPGATVGGKVAAKAFAKGLAAPASLRSWWDHALSHGSLLTLGGNLGWLWTFSMMALAFYALLALVFPEGMRTTGDMLVRRPAAVALSAVLTMIALPVLFVLLCITVVGIPVAFLALPAGVGLAVIFGKAAIYGLVGRSASGDRFNLAVSVLIGGLIFMVLYMAPLIGVALSALTSVLGLGCAVTALLSGGKKAAAPAPVGVPPVVPAPVATFVPANPVGYASAAVAAAPVSAAEAVPPAAQSAGFGAAETVPPTAAVPPLAVPPPVLPAAPSTPNAALARAGFWIRTGAILIDLILISMICGPIGAGPIILPALAAYGAAMWKFKGTTIGGIVCRLKVVRLDDRPLDWPTTVVRALGCFLSLAVVGLGFVWVVFDDDRQSWHDKIAGTVVVRTPKGTSLV